ncbi:hypothetical protein BS78_01G470600 [Paspalum vaginatum]|nr:hypothetical protein BS78_01G470600 [Paspalum vaginatum]
MAVEGNVVWSETKHRGWIWSMDGAATMVGWFRTRLHSPQLNCSFRLRITRDGSGGDDNGGDPLIKDDSHPPFSRSHLMVVQLAPDTNWANNTPQFSSVLNFQYVNKSKPDD